MKESPASPSLDWARRVNRSWIVRNHLDEHAEAWLEYLAALDDGRLQPSCETARAMCGLRERLEDPKPWFYAGLFSHATAEEARRFLGSHRTTKATVPAVQDDEEVRLWFAQVGPETRDLLTRLRRGLATVCQIPPTEKPVDPA
jgi:hypothetical protein